MAAAARSEIAHQTPIVVGNARHKTRNARSRPRRSERITGGGTGGYFARDAETIGGATRRPFFFSERVTDSRSWRARYAHTMPA